jgi:carbonic anhydrase
MKQRQTPSSEFRHFERYGQDSRPEALLITCTDPILDSSLIAQLSSEPLLVWRNTGPVVPPYGAGHRDAEGVIEHALAGLGVQEIAICGHLPCGSLGGPANGKAPAAGPAENSCRFYAQAASRIVQEKYGCLSPEELLNAVVEENVFVQMANLRTYPAVLAGLARGDLKMHSWIYDADKDEIFGHGPKHSPFLGRIKRLARPSQRLLPCLDPCDIYLA